MIVVKLEAYDAADNTRKTDDDFTFDPGPRKITKTVKREWRVRHRGRKRLRKFRDRRREHADFTMEGGLTGPNRFDNRNKLDYLSRHRRVFKLLIQEDTTSRFPSYTLTDFSQTWSYASEEDIYVIIDSFNSSISEGRGVIDYTIVLKQVEFTPA